ncbi:uncharacterized protein EDB93DRAFT_1163901 [Suillus bovinus]|uniref:uncharacterized protein n=1 Tax=Suillus bovinus TaxID=48563 RepID=UPI001B87A09D|nr:uncharacterized protein EDB93DRAFT_1163901 [Suillus bovinus]KAG2139202.1 hypothetical protein EDB93DRAFT_1163901 [Suillus bovinus]
MVLIIIGGVIALSVAINAIFKLYHKLTHDDHRLQPVRTMPVGAIGWTQDSISSRVYNVTLDSHVEIQAIVDAALSDPRGALAFMREHFPDPIRIFDSGKNGFLSIDNRRLAIFRMVLSSEIQIPVRVLTREQAGQALLQSPDGVDPKAASDALHRRCTTRDGGFSIMIRGPQRTVISNGCSTN